MDKIRNHGELDIYFQDVHHTDIKTIEGEVDLRSFISGVHISKIYPLEGKVYFNLIRPFHHLVVSSMMREAGI